MERVLNRHTDTIHKSRQDDHYHRTECGALSHVDDRHVQTVSDDRSRDDAVSRCGRCFDASGGY
jgi:hypothetical protein